MKLTCVTCIDLCYLWVVGYLLQVDFPPKLVVLPLNALIFRLNFAAGGKLNASGATEAGSMGRRVKDML